MRDENAIMRETLLAIRLELDNRRIPMKVCASKAGVSYSTFLSWFPADGTPQIPSLGCLAALSRALPGDLFDLLLPDDFHATRCPKDVDYDDFAAGCRAFLEEMGKAVHPDSPAGRDISDCEASTLGVKVIPLRGVVG